MTEKNLESLRLNQQIELISSMERSIQDSDFEWAFDLYSIFFVLFPEKYNEALIAVFQTLEDNNIKNWTFERNVIGFSLEKTICNEDISERITQTILDLLKTQRLSTAIRIINFILFIEWDDILPSVEPKFSKRVNALILAELKTECKMAYSEKNWLKIIQLHEMVKPVLPESSLNHFEQLFRTAWQNFSDDIKIVLDGEEIKEKLFSKIKNGVQFLTSVDKPGSVEIRSPFGSITQWINDHDIFVKRRGLSFGIPFEQEEPSVVAEDKMILMQVYPGFEKAKIVVTLKTD